MQEKKAKSFTLIKILANIGEMMHSESRMRKSDSKIDNKTEKETRLPMSTNLKRKLAGFIAFQAGQERRSQASMLEILAEAGVMQLYKEEVMKWLKLQEEEAKNGGANGHSKRGNGNKIILPLLHHSRGFHPQAIRELT